jgi:uncharacterized membrane protein YgcG
MPHSSATARQEEEAKASAAAAVSAAASSAAAAAASAAAASAAVAAATAADAISTAQRSMSTLRVWMACTQVVRSSCQTVFSRLRQIQSSFSAVEAVAAAHREALKVAEATVAVAQERHRDEFEALRRQNVALEESEKQRGREATKAQDGLRSLSKATLALLETNGSAGGVGVGGGIGGGGGGGGGVGTTGGAGFDQEEFARDQFSRFDVDGSGFIDRYGVLFALNYFLPSTTFCPQLFRPQLHACLSQLLSALNYCLLCTTVCCGQPLQSV